MKNIFPTIEYVAEKIKEAITGHKNDEQAHPNLSEQINVLSKDRGYVNTLRVDDFNDAVKNGKYLLTFNGDGVAQHAPHGITAGEQTYTIDVTAESDLILKQEIVCIYGVSQGRKFYRVNTFGRWSNWEEEATTTKTDILFPFNTGYSGHWASSNKIVKNSLGQCVIYVSVKKTDGSDFTPGIVTIGTLPQGFKSKLNCGVGAYTETTSVGAGAFIYNQDVVNVNVQSNCKVVAFTLFYEVI